MPKRLLKTVCCIVSSAVVFAIPSLAQDQWSWPEKPKNLQVLNKDWPGARLRPVMTGFTRALGVRCSYCHTGEEGKPLGTYDFASDQFQNSKFMAVDARSRSIAWRLDLRHPGKVVTVSAEPASICFSSRPQPRFSD